MGAIIIDIITSAAEKGTIWFNEAWFIKLVEKAWVLIPFSLFIKKLRKWLYKIFNDAFNSLPFMTRLAATEKAIQDYSIMQKKNHEENSVKMDRVISMITEIGKTAKKTNAKIRAFEIQSPKAIIEFDANLNAIQCSNAFLSLVKQITKEEIMDLKYLNCVEFSDVQTLQDQLSIVKDQKRKTSFPLKISTGSQVYITYWCVIEPYLCIENEFTGCIMELIKI